MTLFCTLAHVAFDNRLDQWGRRNFDFLCLLLEWHHLGSLLMSGLLVLQKLWGQRVFLCPNIRCSLQVCCLWQCCSEQNVLTCSDRKLQVDFLTFYHRFWMDLLSGSAQELANRHIHLLCCCSVPMRFVSTYARTSCCFSWLNLLGSRENQNLFG